MSTETDTSRPAAGHEEAQRVSVATVSAGYICRALAYGCMVLYAVLTVGEVLARMTTGESPHLPWVGVIPAALGVVLMTASFTLVPRSKRKPK